MSLVKVAAIQLDCVADPQANLAHAEKLVRKAADEGAKIILLFPLSFTMMTDWMSPMRRSGRCLSDGICRSPRGIR